MNGKISEYIFIRISALVITSYSIHYTKLYEVYSRCLNCSFSVCPVFMETLLDFRGSAEIRVKIYSLIFPFIKFIFNWKTLSFTYSIVKEKLRGSSKLNS